MLLTGAELGIIGCARDIDKSPPIDLSKVVRAQFDPSNAIPVLSLIPSPTGLAQMGGTGPIDKTQVAPYKCELPSTKQCLQFVDSAWPTSTPITLYFSGDVDQASLMNGVQLFEIGAGGAPAPVAIMSFAVMPRPAPPAACKAGDNGSKLTYMDADVPPGVQVIVQPAAPLKNGTQYVMFVKSTADGGLRATNGSRVEPSALFSLMNAPEEARPVTADGKIVSALLRSSVHDAAVKAVGGGKAESQLSDDEKAAVAAAVDATGKKLALVYTFFNAVITPFAMQNVVNRSDLVWANGWKTADADPTTLEFDPNAQKVPFPNNPLLTTVVSATVSQGGLLVNLPICTAQAVAAGACMTEDPPLTQALLGGLNTLNGFSTTASISMTFTRDIDPSTLAGKVFMYPVSATGTIEAQAVDIVVRFLKRTDLAPPTLMIRPSTPLEQNKNYVVVVRSGIMDANGRKVASAQTFDLLKIPTAFVDMNQVAAIPVVAPAGMCAPGQACGGTFQQALECSFVQTRGTLGSSNEVFVTAQALELRAQHQRWVEGFRILEGASPPIPRTDVLMAFTYKTQTITDTVDLVKNALLSPAAWEMLLGAGGRVMGPVATFTGTTAIAAVADVVGQLCLGLCDAGQLTQMDGTPIPQAMCRQPNGTASPIVANHPLCGTAKTIVVGGLGQARLYLMSSYTALSGGPFQQPNAMHGAGTFTPPTVMRPRVVPIPIWVVTSAQPAGPSGYPIAVFQHGLGSRKEAGFYIANTLATTTGSMNPGGWATVLMDLPFHGMRASDICVNGPDPTDPTNEICVAYCDGMGGHGAPVDPANVTCDPQTGRCTGGCDGKQDPSGSGFLGLNLFATRDAFRQGTIDQLTLLRMLREEGKPGGKLPFLDGTRIGYIGQSLGGITGGNLAAYLNMNEMTAMVLNVGGGGLAQNILPNSVEAIVAPLLAGLAATGNCDLVDPRDPGKGCKDNAAYRRFVTIAEWVLDPGDPLANAIGVRGPRPALPGPLTKTKILLQMSKPDPVVSNIATRALAKAYDIATDGSDSHFQAYDFTRVPQSQPSSAPGWSGCHAWLLAPRCGLCLVDVLCNTLGAQVQAAQFLNSNAGPVGPQRPAAAILPGTPRCDNPCPM